MCMCDVYDDELEFACGHVVWLLGVQVASVSVLRLD